MNLHGSLIAFGWMLALCGAASLDAGAQAPEREPGAGRPRGERSAERAGQYVDRLMETIRAENPEEFKRLTKMREQDPEQFRLELRRKLIELRRARGEEGHGPRRPRPDAGSDEPGDRPPRGERPTPDGPEGPGEKHPAPWAEWQELRELAQQHREAEAPRQKERLERAIRTKIGELHERRQQERRARIERFEQELERMKSDLQRLDEERDTLIERRFQELIRPKDLPVRSGRPERPSSPPRPQRD